MCNGSRMPGKALLVEAFGLLMLWLHITASSTVLFDKCAIETSNFSKFGHQVMENWKHRVNI